MVQNLSKKWRSVDELVPGFKHCFQACCMPVIFVTVEEVTSNPTGHPGLVDLVCWCLSWTWEMAQKIVSDTSSLLRMLLIFLIQDDWSPTVILKIRTSCEQSPQLRMSPAPWWFFSMLQQCPDPCFSENIFNVVSVRMRNMNIDSRSCICVWRMSKVKIN